MPVDKLQKLGHGLEPDLVNRGGGIQSGPKDPAEGGELVDSDESEDDLIIYTGEFEGVPEDLLPVQPGDSVHDARIKFFEDDGDGPDLTDSLVEVVGVVDPIFMIQNIQRVRAAVLTAIKDPNLSEELKRIFQLPGFSKFKKIVCALSVNNADILLALVREQDSDIRRALAKNSNIPVEVADLIRIENPEYTDLIPGQLVEVGHSGLYEDLRKIISQLPLEIAKTTKHPMICNILATDEDFKVRAALLRNLNTVEVVSSERSRWLERVEDQSQWRILLNVDAPPAYVVRDIFHRVMNVFVIKRGLDKGRTPRPGDLKPGDLKDSEVYELLVLLAKNAYLGEHELWQIINQGPELGYDAQSNEIIERVFINVIKNRRSTRDMWEALAKSTSGAIVMSANERL